jgi:hypothetical protein
VNAPAIRLNVLAPRLRMVGSLPCKNAPEAGTHRGANDAGNIMAKRTTKTTKSKGQERTVELVRSQ